MKRLDNLSIRVKQTLIIMLTSTVALLLACVALVAYDTITFRQELVERESRTAQIIGNAATAAVEFNDQATAEESLAALKAEPNIVAACIYDRQGRLFASFQRDAQSAKFPFPPAQPAGQRFTNNSLHLFQPIKQGNEQVGTIFVAANLEELSERLANYARLMGVVFVASLLIALAVSSRLQRVISNPILHLAHVAQAVALEKNYAARATKQSGDELGLLIDSFNEMLSQIQQRDNALQTARENLEGRVKERTAELAESFSLLHATLESTTDGIVALDLSGQIIFYNSKFVGMWQFRGEVLTRRDSQEVILNASKMLRHPEEFVALARRTQSDPEAEVFNTIEFLDGRVFERYALPARIDGKCVGVVVNWRDITQRKRATEALAVSEERFRSVWERSVEGMRLTDREGRIVDVNEAYCKLVRLSREELVGQVFAVTYNGHAPKDSIEAYIERFDSGSILPRIEARVELWNRETRDLEISSSLIESGQQGRMMLSTFRDVTERKRTEAQLKKVQSDLIESSRLAGMAEVASNVLHNVGNVLNSVNVSATLVADSLRKSKAGSLGRVVALLDEHSADLGSFLAHDPKGRQLPGYLRQLGDYMTTEQAEASAELESLRKNIEHIKDIVAMQQSYAKVSGQKEVLDVTGLVEDSLQMNAGALARHAVELVRDYQTVPLINVEKHKVLQILVNLIRNAKYACDDSGRTDKRIVIRLGAEQDKVKISIADNGVGIPPENLTRIFSHGFTTRKNGHGFGLHSGALAAKEMGGALLVHSPGHGQGAVFTLELPCDLVPENS